MYPKQISKIPDAKVSRKAVAPYNFVELPDTIVQSENTLLRRERYSSDLHTGHIDCKLTTESPLFIRAGLTPQAFQDGEESKCLADFFYTDPLSKTPVLPGSSLRGMFRTLVEIASYSKISKVSDQQRFFFRAVAAPSDDSIGNLYKQTLRKDTVKAGYLKCKDGKWFVKPAKTIEGSSFVWVKDSVASNALSTFTSLQEQNYLPQYIPNISFEDIFTKNARKFAGKVSSSAESYEYVGVLVSSGNMVETNQSTSQTPRKNHCLVREPEANAEIQISEKAVWHYCNSLTDFQQQEPPFRQESGVLKVGRCIFYSEPPKGQSITLFGQSPNFRIPYSFLGNGEAASAADFVPASLKSDEAIDIAETIFGYVRDRKKTDFQKQSRAGRVSFSEGTCLEEDLDDLFMVGENGRVPKILSSPKPTTFQHYLVQTSADKSDLKHYASQPEADTVIRGHKLYWHQGRSPDIWHPEPDAAPETQITRIRPLKPGKCFGFKIDFENLSSVELGALLWVLEIAQKEEYRLSLGMGKPLGMGAVKVEHSIYVGNRTSRYGALFDAEGDWFTALDKASTKNEKSQHIRAFEQYVLKNVGERGKSKLSQLRRIKMLLTMLSWDQSLSEDEKNERRYMGIERSRRNTHAIGSPVKPQDQTIDEYNGRPVLPTPLQVAQVSSKPRQLAVGMIFEAFVLEKKAKGSQVKYEIFDEVYREREKKAFTNIPESGPVKVEIRSLKEDGSIKHVKFIEISD